MFQKASFLCVLLLQTIVAQAQQLTLPQGHTPEERALPASEYNKPRSGSRAVTTPPEFPVRTMAQWEEVQTLVLTWTSFPYIQSQIVKAARQECQVLIHCADSVQVRNYLTGQGIPLSNVNFIQTPFNSIWIRDYGAHTVYKNAVDSLLLVDWIYNRPRPDDDAIPQAYATYKNIGLFSTSQAPHDLVNTGGNWMVDGFGTAFASKLILDENSPGNPYGVTAKTEAQIDTIMKHFMGIDRYIKMETLPYDDIHHIDMHMKLLDEETLLVGEYPQSVSDGPQIEANLQYVLSQYNSVFGTPYKVIRIPQPPAANGNHPGPPFGNASYRTYTNSVFVNKTLIVPVYRQEYDTIALRILQDALPGYTITGIDVDDLPGNNLIGMGGAIHCITNLIGADSPLLISHQSLRDTYDTQHPYTVTAFAQHKSGIASATLYYTTDLQQPYQSVPMSASGSDYWTADIPAQAAGTNLYYYVSATAQSGKTQVRPMTAPDGYFQFKVLGSSPVAVDETVLAPMLRVFPNPASAITCVPLTTNRAFEGSLRVYDVLGHLVETLHSGYFAAGESNYFIRAETYTPGAYLIVLETPESRWVQRLMVR